MTDECVVPAPHLLDIRKLPVTAQNENGNAMPPGPTVDPKEARGHE